MGIAQLIYREMAHRKVNALLSLAVIVAAVALFAAFFTTGRAARQETVRLMRDIGFNLRVIPRVTDMDRFWATGYSAHTMPDRYVNDLAAHDGISYAHLVAVLQRKAMWRDHEVLLTGVAPEVSPPGRKKSPMGFSVEPGTVYVGFELSRSLELDRGETVDISGRTFTVARCLPETGSEDDIRIYAHLSDVQDLLGMTGRINEIKALQCLCVIDGINANTLAQLREELERALPEAKVIRIQSIADAREKQRLMADNYVGFILPSAMLVCMAWIGILSLMNVRDRQQEIGIMRAIGYGSGKIAGLFLGRAIGIGLAGAAIGFGIGTALALRFGPDIFRVTANKIEPDMALLFWSLLAAPALCALSALIPAMTAVLQDPAQTLREG